MTVQEHLEALALEHRVREIQISNIRFIIDCMNKQVCNLPVTDETAQTISNINTLLQCLDTITERPKQIITGGIIERY